MATTVQVHKRALAGKHVREEGALVPDHEITGGDPRAAEQVTRVTRGEDEVSIATRLDMQEGVLEADLQHQHKAMKAELMEQVNESHA